MATFNKIKNDFKKNKKSGIFTLFILTTYRLGNNTNNKFFRKILSIFHRFFSLVIGCSLPYGCQLGENVWFPHGMVGVFISQGASIGNNCVILHNVTIGSKFLNKKTAPKILDNSIIGAGAVVVGDVIIGENVRIAPNSFVDYNINSYSTVKPQNKLTLRRL